MGVNHGEVLSSALFVHVFFVRLLRGIIELEGREMKRSSVIIALIIILVGLVLLG